MSLSDFFSQLAANPALIVTTILTLATIIVNGCTDAPNAIATCVSTKALGVRQAVVMAAVFNFLGVFVMTTINSKVAMTIYNMVDYGDDPQKALAALGAALAAIVIWATACWYFGIPTSESHSLVAGLAGAAVALRGGVDGINGSEVVKVIYGLVLSTVLGFVMGFVVVKIVAFLFRNAERRSAERFFSGAQVASGASMAFMHGAQDGQKFMGVFMLGLFLSNGQTQASEIRIPVWLMLICSAFMALGTSVGGYRIIKSVGMDMVKLSKYQGFSADLAGTLCLLLSSLLGVPVSTTHTKTSAIMGVGAARRMRSVNWSIAGDMVWAWVLTFPGCGIIGYAISKLFLAIF